MSTTSNVPVCVIKLGIDKSGHFLKFSMPILVTPKAHAVFHHITELIKLQKVGLFSEQSTEALHLAFSGPTGLILTIS